MALALYRKYRPATFAEVVGQEHVTEPLRTALAAGRINHAYLFSGPRGCGKTSSARILARSLNCVSGPTPDPCGSCPSCVALAPEGPGSLDVVELDAASHGGVSDTRELRDRAFYMPAESRYRVFIIDEAHMVTKEGFNALLKIVEEPPEHLVFVFATTEPDKVLPTIRSRTHHYPFRLLPPATLRALLERLCREEGVAVETAVYPLVVKAGAGSARDALSVMDQLLAGAGEAGVSYADAVALLGVTDGALLDELVDALAASDGAGVFGAIDRVVEAGHDPRRFGADLLQRLRDLVIIQAVPDAVDKSLLDAPADELAAMAAQSGRIPAATLTRFAEILHAGLSSMRGTTSPRLVLELLCARMLLPAASADEAGFLQRLERLERRMEIAADHGVPSSGASTVPPPAASVYDVPDGQSRTPGGSGRAAAARPAAAPEPAEARDAGASASSAAGPARPTAPSLPGTGSPAEAGPGADLDLPTPPALGTAGPGPAAGPDLGLPTPPVLSSDRPASPVREAADGPVADARSVTQPAQAPHASRGEGSPDDPGLVAGLAEAPAADASSGEARPTTPDTTVTVADVRRLWPEILAAVKAENRTAHALLESAAVTALSVDGGVLQLSTRFAALARMISEPRNSQLLRDAMRSVLGVDWRVRCDEADGDPVASAGPAGGARADQYDDVPPVRSAPETGHGSGVATGGGVAPDARPGSAGPSDRDSRRAAPPGDQPGGPPGDQPGHRSGDQLGYRSGQPSVSRVSAAGPPEHSGPGEPDDDDPYQGIDPDNDVTDPASFEVADPSKTAAQLLAAKLGARPIDG